MYNPTPQAMGVREDPASGCHRFGCRGFFKDLRRLRIPYQDANPANLDDFILKWEDFVGEFLVEMHQDVRDKWASRTFRQSLASELDVYLRDQIREKRISREEQCLKWLEQEERVDAPNQYPSTWSVEN